MIARTVGELNLKYPASGERGFMVKQYPKNGQWRKAALSRELVAWLAAGWAQ